MKKHIAILIALALLCAMPALAEATLADAAAALEGASTLDERLAALYDLSVNCAAAFENGGWDVNLDLYVQKDDALDAILPDVADAEATDALPEALADAKFIAVHDAFKEREQFWGRWLMGNFMVRLPEANRAKSIEEATAVLYLKEWLSERKDYTGEAYDRVYDLYAASLDGGDVWLIDHFVTEPPYSGMGVLSGESLSSERLWLRFGGLFSGTASEFTISYKEGTAHFRVTGGSCCLAELEGRFDPVYEVPAEVEGLPVTGIESLRDESTVDYTIRELVLPEGLIYITGNHAISLVSLESIRFPSTLRRVTGKDVFNLNRTELTELAFNEGLEEIGPAAIPGGGDRLERVILPSTLRSLGDGFLENGLKGTWVALPEGLTRVPDGFLSEEGNVECVFLPASIETFDSKIGRILDKSESTRIYAPEGSVAAAWAVEHDKPYIPCESEADMPKPSIETEGDYTYTVVEGEAMLMKYTGADADVTVPDALGGCPVTVVKTDAFEDLEALETLRFPDTLRMLESDSIRGCTALKGVYVPGSPEHVHFSFIDYCGDAKVYAPADSAIAAMAADYAIPWVEWDPDAA